MLTLTIGGFIDCRAIFSSPREWPYLALPSPR
jgi:hypothetical protein